MIRLTRRYRFSASHRLHNPAWTEERNQSLYGRCNNPHGHGHDYVLEVSLRGEVDAATGRCADWGTLDRLVGERVLAGFDRRDLNSEVPEFAECVPTTENLARVVEARLRLGWEEAFGVRGPALDRIRIQETRRNSVEL